MSEIEEQNKNLRIKQQKDKMFRRIILCLAFILVITLVYVYINRSATGTEIDVNTYVEQLTAGNIKEIDLNQTKIQIYYKNGEAHWLYRRDSIEEDVLSKWNELNEQGLEVPILVSGTTTTVSILNIVYPILLIASLIFMIVFITRQLKNTNNKNFEFVKNRARIYPSKTKFTDVAGAEEEKQELEDVVDFLKNPNKYTELGAKIPKGVLLVGPPGTGKTLLARAVAGEANVPFFTISGSDFMELFVGVGASRVRDLFETAKKAKPCIIFIDEIDAVGRQRGAGLGGGNDEREQTLNQLLVQMDGFEENEGIIVMAATNRVDILDPALLRPGRFDRRINIGVPDIKGREEILKVHSRNKKFAKNIDFKTIARITSGFTGAELENLLNEAAIMVAKDNRKFINEEDIQKAIMKVTLGPQKRSRVIDEKDRLDTAIHESGHALISKLAKEKSPVHEVSIIPRGGAGGYTLSTDDDSTVYFKEKLLCKIQMLLGGITAEKLYVGDISTGASNDLKRASSIARRMVTEWGMSSNVGMVYCGSSDEVFIGKSYQERMPYSESQGTLIDEEIKKIIDSCQKETERILTENKDVLMTMANVLLERETIYAEEVDMIIAGKTKEEVIDYIDHKDKRSTLLQQDNQTKTENSSNYVDELIKNAEIKEKQAKTTETNGVKEQNTETEEKQTGVDSNQELKESVESSEKDNKNTDSDSIDNEDLQNDQKTDTSKKVSNDENESADTYTSESDTNTQKTAIQSQDSINLEQKETKEDINSKLESDTSKEKNDDSNEIVSHEKIAPAKEENKENNLKQDGVESKETKTSDTIADEKKNIESSKNDDEENKETSEKSKSKVTDNSKSNSKVKSTKKEDNE